MIASVNGALTQSICWPTLEVTLTYLLPNGKLREWAIPSCRFHDLRSSPDEELAGMGLAILGNLIKTVGHDLYDAAVGADLLLRRGPTDAGTPCPWPGMPNDAPIPLDLMAMPFDTAMFLDADQFKYRLDRWQLMARIQHVWVPWLKAQLVKDA